MNHVQVIFLALILLLIPRRAQGQAVVISQVYGGGGNVGSTLRNDFIELFNRGNTSVNLAGWSIQYASANGNSWDRTVLSGTVAPGQYYLIQEAEGNAGFSNLPSSDALGGINLSAMSGKIALVSNSNVLSGGSPAGAQVVDFVGYGTANFSEGRPTGALSNTTAAIRGSNGCTDTGNNQADFSIGSPNPRNSRSPVNICAGAVSAAPQISEAGVTNGASFLPGPVAPGEIVVISGSGFGPPSPVMFQLTPDGQFVTKSLVSTRVLFDGVAAPIIFAAANQVSAVVPFGTAGRSNTSIQLEYNGIASNRITLPVSAIAPGVFTTNSLGQGNIINEDLSVNGLLTPAPKGSVVVIYATGAGQTIPEGNDGWIVGNETPRPILPIAVRIGGVDAEVLSTGAAPGRVSGFLLIRARVPDGLPAVGSVALTIMVGDKSSQAGVTIAVAPAPAQDGSDLLIDEKLQRLKTDPSLSALPEIPTDRSPAPVDWLALLSWNVQVGGTSVTPGALRPPMVKAALSSLFTGTYQLLAAQEVPSADSAQLLRTLLPGGTTDWQSSFFNTSDTMDNGFWYRTGMTLRDSFPLFITNQTDSSGRIITDPSRAVHPPQVAQFEVGDFDFTLITVHLTFANGDTSQSVRELREILDYLDWYFIQPDHDPDVIVCGDFNIPSALSGQTGKGGITLDAVFDEDPRFRTGERRFVVTVHQPTSRGPAATGGLPASNYDHCVLSANTMKAFVQARRVSIDTLTDHPDDPEVRLTSDHFPIVAFFKIRGERIVLDRKTRIRPQ